MSRPSLSLRKREKSMKWLLMEGTIVSAEEEGVVDMKVMTGADKLDSVAMIMVIIVNIESGEEEGIERRGGELGLVVWKMV